MTEACATLAPLLVARPFDLLEPADALRVEEHLASGCLACESVSRDVALALAAAPCAPVEPQPAIREQLLARVAADRANVKAGGPAPVAILLTCTYCHGTLARREARFCAGCLAPGHADCFEAHGRCAAPGCGETRLLDPTPVVARPRESRRRSGLVLALGIALGAGAVAALSAVSLRQRDADVRRVIEDMTPGYREAMKIIRARDRSRYDEARDHLQGIPSGSLLYPEAQDGLAWLSRQKDAEDWVNEADDAIRQGSPVDAEAPLVSAVAAIDSEARGELAARLVALRRSKEFQADSLCRKAQSLVEWVKDAQGNWTPRGIDAAVDAFSKAIEVEPRWEKAWLGRARLRLDGHRFDEALRDLDRAVELAPADQDAWETRSSVRLGSGDRKGAVAELDEAAKRVPPTASALRSRAYYRREAGDLDGAIADATAALELAKKTTPTRPGPDGWEASSALRERATARKGQGRLTEALADLDASIGFRDGDDVRLERAELRLETGDEVGARQDFERALKLAGETYGDTQGAIDSVKKRIAEIEAAHRQTPR